MIKPEIIFKLPFETVVISNPEDLANRGISMHPDAVEQTFGKGSAEIYEQTMKSRREGDTQSESQVMKPRVISEYRNDQ